MSISCVYHKLPCTCSLRERHIANKEDANRSYYQIYEYVRIENYKQTCLILLTYTMIICDSWGGAKRSCKIINTQLK